MIDTFLLLFFELYKDLHIHIYYYIPLYVYIDEILIS